ncbi:hypothetical protein FF2_002288 [Malus domestica]
MPLSTRTRTPTNECAPVERIEATVHKTLGCLQEFDGGEAQKSRIGITIEPRCRRCLIWTRQPDPQLEELKSEPNAT